jgi:serine/threonine protein kinase
MSDSAERWQQIEELYHAVCVQGPAALSGVDPELRHEVESLLEVKKNGDELLERQPALHYAAVRLAPGSMIGSYRVEASIGAGGMGEVYRATDTRLQRSVALKVLPAIYAQDPVWLARFHREARVLAALNHPNIVTIYEVSTHDGAPVIVMEYVPGNSLDRLIPRNGLRLSAMLNIGGQLASALASAAAAGVIHRDLKPGNVMVTGAGIVKVLDFGLANCNDARPPRKTLRRLRRRPAPARA